jgi:hypothetical protein
MPQDFHARELRRPGEELAKIRAAAIVHNDDLAEGLRELAG